MGEANWWVMDILLPGILLVALIWLVVRTRSNAARKRNDVTAEQGTRNLYREEEARRREGTDDL